MHPIQIILIILTIISIGLLLASVIGLRFVDRSLRAYLYWAGISALMALIAPITAMIRGLGFVPMLDDGNFIPFVYFAGLFFLPAAFVLLIMAWHENNSLRTPQEIPGLRTRTITGEDRHYGREIRPGS